MGLPATDECAILVFVDTGISGEANHMIIFVAGSDPDRILRARRLLFSYGLFTVGGSYRTAINSHHDAQHRAILLIDPHDPQRPTRFSDSYRMRHPGNPILCLEGASDACRDPHLKADRILNADLAPARLVTELIAALSALTGMDIADCIVGAARDHLLMPHPTWNGVELPLTPTERAIWRYLILTYPRPITAKELLRYCTKPDSSCDVSNIPCHIYRINRKTEALSGRRAIACPDNIGYRLFLQDDRENDPPTA